MLGFSNTEEGHELTKFRRGICFVLTLLIVASLAYAQAAPAATVQKVRFSLTPEKVRLVVDMNDVPDFNVTLEEDRLRLLVNLPAALDKAVPRQYTFNDPFVSSVQLEDNGAGQLQVIVNLKAPAVHKVFKLAKPNRLVIDLLKMGDQKTEQQVKPGIKYSLLMRNQAAGPEKAYVLLVDPKAGFALRPVLSNGVVQGVETLAAMSASTRAVAAVNGSYFDPNGEIIGLLKIDGEIISTPTIPRTAVGVLPDGRLIFDQVSWQGNVEITSGRVALSGVNRARGDNELILYNGYYGPTTGTNQFGTEYVIGPNGVVMSIGKGNATINAGTVVLSAHGAAAKALAGLRVGDIVTIRQTLGQVWDGAVHALGAGPMLVKDGTIYLTTKTEEFGSDVAGGRAPRTAIGVTKEGQILLAVVDGRQVASGGLSLLEMAILMQELGAVDAMNLDGGGSSEMVVFDKVVNKPSDGRERKIGNALVIVPAGLAN